jgi:hypothetical protein
MNDRPIRALGFAHRTGCNTMDGPAYLDFCP